MKKNIEKKWFFLPLILLSLIPMIWFFRKDSILINGVDTNFPLDPKLWLLRRFFAWDNISNAGLPTAANIAGIIFHSIQTLPYVLGFDLQNVELFSLIFWFSLVIVSSYLFAKLIVPKSKLAQLAFVSFYSFNTYLFNTWENIKVSNIALIIGTPLFLSILFSFEKKLISLKKLIFLSVISSIIISGSGINPAYFLTILLSVLIWVILRSVLLLRGKAVKEYLIGVLSMVIIMVLANIFWIIPTVQYLLLSQQTLTNLGSIGFTNWVNSLSENTSILNVLRIQGAWDWYSVDSVTGAPLYIPYSVNYFFKLPFILFSFLIPSLAIISFIFKNRKEKTLYGIFGIFIILGLFFGVGTHEPTGILFAFLGTHLPFFSFFRSPWYIFTPLLTIGIAGAISLLVDEAFVRWSFLKVKRNYLIASCFIVALVISNLIYCYPLVTGKIFRPDLPNGFYVRFPNYVFQAKDWLNKRYLTDQTRIIGYPGGDTEQFNWGYRGEESILELFSPYEVLFSPLNNTESSTAALVQIFYQDLQKGAIESSENIAAKLNIGMVFQKNDQASLDPPLPAQITSLPSTSFGKWTFYRLPNSQSGKIYTASDLIGTNAESNAQTPLDGLLESKDLLVLNTDSTISKIPQVSSITGNIIKAENSQLRDFEKFQTNPYSFASGLSDKDTSKVNFDFNIPIDGVYEPIMERYKLEDFGIDLSKPVNSSIDGNQLTLSPERITNSYVYFSNISMKAGNHQISLYLQNPNLIEGGGDMVKFSKSGLGNFQITETNQGKYLTLANNSNNGISAIYNVLNFNPLIPYLIRSDYRQIYGNYAQIEAFQFNSITPYKSQAQSLPNYPDWKSYEFYYVPVNSASTLQVYLNAPPTKDPLGTTVEYENLSIRKIFTNNLFLLNSGNITPLATPKINFKQNSPVSYNGSVTGGETPHLIVFSENYSPNWELTLYDSGGNRLPIELPHFTANSYANAWYIRGTPSNYKFLIYYKPQTMLNISFAISGLTILGAIAFFLLAKKEVHS